VRFEQVLGIKFKGNVMLLLSSAGISFLHVLSTGLFI
jgi:hypothetical protein